MSAREELVQVMAAAERHGLRLSDRDDGGLVQLTCKACGWSTGCDTVAAQYGREPHGCLKCGAAS